MAFNPNAVFISPSSLGDFEKCPRLYYYRNVYKTPRGLKIQIVNPPLALGQAVHDTLQIFTRLPAGDRDKDTLWAKYDFAWSNLSGEKGGFLSEKFEQEAKERGRRMLERFWANRHFQITEQIKTPGFPKVELGGDLILTGKLDWLEKGEAGYHLVDFKTGKEEREDSLQLPIYAVLIADLFRTASIRASYWYLDASEEPVDFPLPEIDRTRVMLKQKGEIIKMARQTNSFRCQSGGESCWACRDILAVANGRGKLVAMDPINRKQEIYILTEGKPKVSPPAEPSPADDLPF